LDKGVWNCHYCGYANSLNHTEDWEKPFYNPIPLSRKKPEYKKPKPPSGAGKRIGTKALLWFAGRGISEKALTDLKVTEGEEYMPQKNANANTIQFNYYHNGELVNTKFRTGDKCFKLVSGAELLPYNLDGIKGTREVIITEGEMDALSFHTAGRTDVVSVPNGANANLSYFDDYIEEYFDDKETVYIAVDSDAKGTLLRDELVRRFGIERCRIMSYGEGCKDANEHLMKFGPQSLLQHLDQSKEIRIEGVFQVSDFEQSLDALFEFGLQRGAMIGHANFDALCSL
jgi:twinkle protein